MEYTESDNVINMTGALPTTDNTGKVRPSKVKYFDFTLEGTIQGTENINWEIVAEDVTTAATDAKVGLLRLGELLSGQFDKNDNHSDYFVLTPYDTLKVYTVCADGTIYEDGSADYMTFHPAMNLKSNVVITGGKCTKESPFTLALK